MKIGGITTTEVCNISCKMCHFNGPTAVRKAGTLTPKQIEKYLSEIPAGQEMIFAGTGEFFMDPNALDHLRASVAVGHKPHILTNGQLLTPKLIDEILEIGVRFIRISVDEIDAEQYRKTRQGGELSVILDACEYLKQQKKKYLDLRVEVNNTLFLNTIKRQEEFVEFWRGKVDAVNFNAEYYEIFKFRNKLFEPKERNDCEMSVYLLPTGQMAPCCAIMVYQHYHNVDWLPHIDDTTPAEAYDRFVTLYNNPESDFRKNICSKCDWWIMWSKDEANVEGSAYWRSVHLTEPVSVPVLATAAVESASVEFMESQSPQPSPIDLHQMQANLAQAQATIQSMRSSKFWKVRDSLAGVKQVVLGTQDPEITLQSGSNHQFTDASQYQAELNRLTAVIEWMQTSKFWKLRTTWFQLKQSIGLPSDTNSILRSIE
ncbi:MAG: hypothetical protein DCF22_10640 [Leptolyngbya sp.]|nr:MAG: hypothetical protein DCF22_10640 [Leptolyngbya sp.]